jgi:hypothetical protein
MRNGYFPKKGKGFAQALDAKGFMPQEEYVAGKKVRGRVGLRLDPFAPELGEMHVLQEEFGG